MFIGALPPVNIYKAETSSRKKEDITSFWVYNRQIIDKD